MLGLNLQPHDILLLQVIWTPVLAIALLVATFALTYMPRKGDAAAVTAPRWFAPNPAKAWGERFFLAYSAVWVTWFGWVVVSGVWEHFAHVEYMVVCGAMAVPCFAAPLWLQPTHEAARPWWSRYWVKANVWIAIISYVGNYFWTHYFFSLLGADYTFPSWRINHVPIAMFLATHAYFCTYHTLTTMALRRWWTSATYNCALPAWLRPLSSGAFIAVLAWFTAFLEAFTIQGFPYYRIQNRDYLYTVGAIVYGMYFVVSFPMFARLDEYAEEEEESTAVVSATGSASSSEEEASNSSSSDGVKPAKRGRTSSVSSRARGRVASASPAAKARRSDVSEAEPAKPAAAVVAAASSASLPSGCWSLSQTAVDSLAGCMLVTIMLDLWRIGYLAYLDKPENGLPWMPFITA